MAQIQLYAQRGVTTRYIILVILAIQIYCDCTAPQTGWEEYCHREENGGCFYALITPKRIQKHTYTYRQRNTHARGRKKMNTLKCVLVTAALRCAFIVAQ